MQLSSEDQLRLNVLVAQPLQAVRIDESRMCVHVLSEKGDASVQLNPTCKDEKYVRLVRQFLSTHYLGSPGGYPVYLKRWTRMGQARDDSLEKLLLVGEPEAVAAVVHASGLTDELARRAWWSSATAENARRMLEKESVVKGVMGPELAKFLIEFLPFEEHQKAIIDSVRLVLQPGLITEELREEVWKRGKRKNVYYVGFLLQTPHDLPVKTDAHNSWSEVCKKIQSEDIQALSNYAEQYHQEHQEVQRLLVLDPSLLPQLKAIFNLSMINETLVDPIFGMTDAIGSVMRKKIEPVVTPIIENIQLLR
jgi:hypothetical protein